MTPPSWGQGGATPKQISNLQLEDTSHMGEGTQFNGFGYTEVQYYICNPQYLLTILQGGLQIYPPFFLGRLIVMLLGTT